MLKRIELPLTNTQLSEFIIDKGYTNYFSFQEYLHQLVESDLIRTITTSKSTSYEISNEGITTLGFLKTASPSRLKMILMRILKKKNTTSKSI